MKHKKFLLLISGLIFFLLVSNNWFRGHDTVDRLVAGTKTVAPQHPQIIPPGLLSCDDCWLAPVDKTRWLPTGYTPTLVELDLPGGGSLTASAAQALTELFAAAKLANINLKVTSSYRSYQRQLSLFNNYIQMEIGRGLPRIEAELLANTYSAVAGHSEHQLGTAVDLNCLGCQLEDSAGNRDAWAWLKAEAHNFGYILSYPEGRESDTGYIYEPWHYRYIGKDLAMRFMMQDRLTLNQWLAQLEQ